MRLEGSASDADGDALDYSWEFQGRTLEAHVMTALGISDDGHKAWFAGAGRDGRGFLAYFEDNGEPGTRDVFKLWIDGALVTGDGGLKGGNVQIHG